MAKVKKSNIDKLSKFDFILEVILNLSVLAVLVMALFPGMISSDSLVVVGKIAIIPALLLIVRLARFKKFSVREWMIVMLLAVIYGTLVYLTI